MVLQVLNARFRPYICSKADTLDTITQAVSMVSILLAQYVEATSNYSDGMSNAGKKIATVLFLLSNVVLTLAHLRIISAPLFAKLRRAFAAAVACARGIGSAETDPAEGGEVMTFDDAVTKQDGAEGDGDVMFDDVATGVSPRFDSSLWATRFYECVMRNIEVQMNPLGDSSDRMTMQTVLQQWRAFAYKQRRRAQKQDAVLSTSTIDIATKYAKPRNAEKQTKPLQEQVKEQLSELHQTDTGAMQTVLQSNPSASSPENEQQPKHLRKRTQKGRSIELQQLPTLHSSAATDAEPSLSVIVHI